MKLFKALFFGLILFPSAAFADTVICRGGGCPPEATSVGLSTGITKAVAGVGISLNPTSGIGEVTFTSLGGGSVGSAGDSIASATMTRVNGGITNSYQINSDTKAFQTATQFVIKSSLAVESTITSTSGFRGPLDYSFLTNVPATSGGSDNLGAHASSKAVNMSGFPITGVSSITFANGATARISSVTIVGTLTSTSPIIGMISSAAVNTIVVAQHFNAINPGTGKILSMAADNSLAWATDQSAAGGGDQMGAHVATMPVVSAFAATFSSLTTNGPISVGGGPAIIDSTQTVLQVRVTDTSDADLEVSESSVSINAGGTMVKLSTDQANTAAAVNNKRIDATLAGNVLITTFTYGLPGPVFFSSMAILNTTSTADGLGEAIFTHNDTTVTNRVGLRKIWIAANNPAQEFTLHFAEQSSGTVRGNRHYVVSAATASNNGGNYSTIEKKLPIAFTVTAPIDGPGSTMTSVTTTGWSALVGPGGCWLYIFPGRDNGISHTLDTSLNPTMTDASALTGGFIQ